MIVYIFLELEAIYDYCLLYATSNPFPNSTAFIFKIPKLIPFLLLAPARPEPPLSLGPLVSSLKSPVWLLLPCVLSTAARRTLFNFESNCVTALPRISRACQDHILSSAYKASPYSSSCPHLPSISFLLPLLLQCGFTVSGIHQACPAFEPLLGSLLNFLQVPVKCHLLRATSWPLRYSQELHGFFFSPQQPVIPDIESYGFWKFCLPDWNGNPRS